MTTTAARLWSRVDKTDSCWLWTGSLNGTGGYGGYGEIRVGGKKLYVHRVVYELLIGPIPEGLELDHLCRVPACCNPAHLEPVSHRENSSPERRAYGSQCGQDALRSRPRVHSGEHISSTEAADRSVLPRVHDDPQQETVCAFIMPGGATP